MTINELLQSALEYSKDNPFTASSAVVVAFYLLFKRPVLFFILLALGLVLIGESEIFSKLKAIGLGS